MTRYITFIPNVINGEVIYDIVNSNPIKIGRLEKVRVGTWMSWCLFLEKDCYLSASCFDEVRERIRLLNNNKPKS